MLRQATKMKAAAWDRGPDGSGGEAGVINRARRQEDQPNAEAGRSTGHKAGTINRARGRGGSCRP